MIPADVLQARVKQQLGSLLFELLAAQLEIERLRALLPPEPLAEATE